MRDLTDKEKIFDFMRLFGQAAKPERDELFRALPEIKERLRLNVELASSPPDLIPEVPGWKGRSSFIAREGKVDFFNFDLYSQALSRIERGHDRDILDVKSMLNAGLVEREKLLELFTAIEPNLFRYPAIEPSVFKKGVVRIARR